VKIFIAKVTRKPRLSSDEGCSINERIYHCPDLQVGDNEESGLTGLQPKFFALGFEINF